MARTYGVGLVGAGAISPTHLTAYQALAQRLRPVGISDIDEVRLRQAGLKHFIPVSTTDYRDLLERDDIDIIDICTPPSTHAPIVRDALEAGKYVVCEKPLASTLEQIDALIGLAEKHPGRLSTIFQRRYAAVVQRLLQARDDGALGQLVGGRFSRYAKGQFVRGSISWGSWALTGGGTVMTQFIHELDLMRLVYGAPASVSATMDTLHLDIESEDTFAATVRFESGALVSCVSAAGVGKSGVSFDVVGTERIFEFSSTEGGDQAGGRGSRLQALVRKGLKVAGSRLSRNGQARPAGDGGSHRPYFEAIIAALDMGQPLPVGPEEARGAVELATAIYTSALSGETVELPLSDASAYYGGVTASAYAGRRRATRLERMAQLTAGEAR